MKTLIFLFAFAMVLCHNCFADTFQVLFKDGQRENYLSGLKVNLLDSRNRVIFTGYTDGFGRVDIQRVNNGTYTLEIQRPNGMCKVSAVIDGGRPTKKILVGRQSCRSATS